MTGEGIGPTWVQQWSRRVWGLAGVGGIAILILFFLTPQLDPLPPPAADSLISAAPHQPNSEGAGKDFSTRPLFMASRQPWRPEPVPIISELESMPAVPAETQEMTGLSLAGIFSSGETEGVIVLESAGPRSRLLLGEEIQGWTLVSVAPRSAMFRKQGGEARLDMSLTSNPSSFVKEVKTAVPAENGAAGDTAGIEEPKPVYVPTFENMYQRKRDALDAAKKTRTKESKKDPPVSDN